MQPTNQSVCQTFVGFNCVRINRFKQRRQSLRLQGK
jgi:hypothetical protein